MRKERGREEGREERREWKSNWDTSSGRRNTVLRTWWKGRREKDKIKIPTPEFDLVKT